ncbi:MULTISPECIES: sulfotransferase [Pseudoalteromonas]|uniref:sulfotransferase n=1 Tax=Pseudoalteromonas TaxID=53246 RepID=UPI001BA5461A|nr:MULTISPECIES: sulfotransferase [Pseudoalteromonas]
MDYTDDIIIDSPKLHWPMAEYTKGHEPHFLFIITPPYSGSTALAEILNTSNKTMLLHESGEGQWLVPGLCEDDRWNSNKVIDYASVKSVWLNQYQKTKAQNPSVKVVVEKSPSNMVRIKTLASQFDSCSFLANNRDPYANCASTLYRHHEADELSQNERLEILSVMAAAWLKRSMTILELVTSLNIPLVTYENFCEDPIILSRVLELPEGVAESIDPYAKVQVKDYMTNQIVNKNDIQINRLSSAEISHLSSIFDCYSFLLEHFNYKIL